MDYVTTAVIGTGYLGRFHAQKYAEIPESKLLGVVDVDARAASDTADKFGVKSYTDYRELLGKVDAVSVVVPTRHHFSVARDFLSHGSHVLVEKPITATLNEADELISLSHTKDRILQVGHLERFNTAILNLDSVLQQPLFIESHRLAPFKPRGTDVSVVLDLMIHDIDIILNIANSDVARIDASGASVLSEAIDIANARLVFENGCVANVTASRVSLKTERKMRIFQQNAYLSIDFNEHVLSSHRKGKRELFPGIPEIESEQSHFEDGDALKTEIQLFIKAIQKRTPPIVSGEDGRRALQTAFSITDLLSSQKQSRIGSV